MFVLLTAASSNFLPTNARAFVGCMAKTLSKYAIDSLYIPNLFREAPLIYVERYFHLHALITVQPLIISITRSSTYIHHTTNIISSLVTISLISSAASLSSMAPPRFRSNL